MIASFAFCVAGCFWILVKADCASVIEINNSVNVTRGIEQLSRQGIISNLIEQFFQGGSLPHYCKNHPLHFVSKHLHLMRARCWPWSIAELGH